MTDLMKEERDRIRAHIRSFPTVESHYCRKDSERLYLGASLNLATMYRLYCETRHKEQAVTNASSTIYCELFRTEFNLDFHNPSKDRCDFCVSFENLSLDEKDKQNSCTMTIIEIKPEYRRKRSKTKKKVGQTRRNFHFVLINRKS
ncbi:tRNA uridine 5-carboxymethylaminomethyl modification enzyme mnmg [Plakobranchus ocellatus]|uniref:tRNA uridine 5-carboxymethylaminomethyl modification enzyme mnmg n=1 Tax=Plakobranchus ocellatus TaxID=259542 RepID=A0AAV4CPG3_9GAST|nr:tRNA uridine 5-carboxymethylaminomethyl modification enzyme mnmg [Plakobranchus ocellatus]